MRSSISHTLGANVESLILSGTAALNGTGNSLANMLTGNSAANTLNGLTGNDTLNGGAGNDTLIGAAGNDTLTGGTGNDYFLFNAALSTTSNVDRISDFNVANDTIRLENAIFKALGSHVGTLTSSMFWKSTSGKSHDSSDRIVYETDTGKLFYDSNGSAAGGSVHFATLATNLALTYADFVVV